MQTPSRGGFQRCGVGAVLGRDLVDVDFKIAHDAPRNQVGATPRLFEGTLLGRSRC